MEFVEVKILCQVVTSMHGTLNQGAILRTDAAFAKHLVDDCGAAEYVQAKKARDLAAPKSPRKAAAVKAVSATPSGPDAGGSSDDGKADEPDAVQTSAQNPGDASPDAPG